MDVRKIGRNTALIVGGLLLIIAPMKAYFDDTYEQCARAKKLSIDLTVEQLNCRFYTLAYIKAEQGNWPLVKEYLEKISDFTLKKEYLELYVRALYENNEYKTLINFVKRLSKRDKFIHFNELIEHYILAALTLESYEDIELLIEFQKKYYPEKVHRVYKQAIYSLLNDNKAQQTILLLNIFPNNIYKPGEKNFIYGVAHYIIGEYKIAQGFFNNALDSDNQTLNSYIWNYLSLISYYLKDSGNIAGEDLGDFTDTAKFNYALTNLENKRLSEAFIMISAIEESRLSNLSELFLTWEAGQLNKLNELLTTVDENEKENSALLSLIVAESEYLNKRFPEAVQEFRLYSEMENSDKEYANYALGHSFKQYYRFNNTAYYWIKNLSNEKTVHDSLALYNLANLYHQTKNYATAETYFKTYLDKYELAKEQKGFYLRYLDILLQLKKIGRLRDILEKDKNILTVEDKVTYYEQIGEYYSERAKHTTAIQYYQKALKLLNNDSIEFKIERAKFALGEYKDSEEFILHILKEYPRSSLNDRLARDLAKYYINQKRHQKAIKFIDEYLSSELNQTKADSLYYLSAIAYKELQENDKALEILENLYDKTKDEGIKKLSINQIEIIILQMDVDECMKHLFEIINTASKVNTKNDYQNILARVYEKNYLFNEANDIYINQLKESSNVNANETRYKIAVNLMYVKDYKGALEYLNVLLSQRGNKKYLEDALFLSYLANYSLGQSKDALKILLNLYYNYPESKKRFDIAKNLIELLIEMDKASFAWFYLNDYYPESSQSQKFTLDKYRDELANSTPAEALNEYSDLNRNVVLEKITEELIK